MTKTIFSQTERIMPSSGINSTFITAPKQYPRLLRSIVTFAVMSCGIHMNTPVLSVPLVEAFSQLRTSTPFKATSSTTKSYWKNIHKNRNTSYQKFSPKLEAATNNNEDNNNNNNNNNNSYTIQVTLSDQTATIPVKADETILSALERYHHSLPNSNPSKMKKSRMNCGGSSRKNNAINTIPIPSSCRRGNCMTCTARHSPSSNRSAISTSHDHNNNNNNRNNDYHPNKKKIMNGLSPVESKRIKQDGWVLICSSKVRGDGVELEVIGEDAWGMGVYSDDEEGDRIRNEAMAKTIRMADEQNLKKWSRKTEKMFHLSSNSKGIVDNME